MKRGFTLIEFAIVLTVAGLALGGAFKLLQTNIKKDRQIAMEQKVEEAIDYIQTFSQASPNDLPTPTEFFANLDLAQYERILYQVAPGLDSDTPICATGDTTQLRIEMYRDSSRTNLVRTINNVAYLLIHSGPNLNIQTVSTPLPGGDIVVYIYRKDVQVDDNASDQTDILDYYDDIVAWRTLRNAKIDAQCYQNNTLRIANTTLPVAQHNQNYVAQLIIDGNYTTPTSSSCTFNPNANLNYIDTNRTITASPISLSGGGTIEASCSVTVDNTTLTKRLVITVNP